MSDYKRFISYIYGYEQGEKRESAGFVRVNARGEECRIWVHLKKFYIHGQQPYQVYVFSSERERLEGWLLGELESRNGALEWNCVTKADSLMESGLSLMDSRGLYIEGGGHIYAAEWDDYPVDVERFVPMKRSARQEKVESVAEVPQKVIVQEEENTALSYDEELRAAQLEIAEEPEESEWEEPEPEELESEELEPEELKSEQTEAEDPRKEQWAYLTRHFPVMQYMDGDAVISSIRLSRRDLARVPRDKWELGNNSFLLHGFYQYHHLLLLRRQRKDGVQYLLGVPGVYNEREQMMASMFGFQEFRVMKEPDSEKGSFGYWCRTLR